MHSFRLTPGMRLIVRGVSQGLRTDRLGLVRLAPEVAAKLRTRPAARHLSRLEEPEWALDMRGS